MSKIARITTDKKLLLADELIEYPSDQSFKPRLKNEGNLTIKEIIEYPTELEGGRNLLPTDYESFVVNDGIYGWIKLTDEGTPLTVKVYDTGANVDMRSIYFGLTKIGKNFTGGGSFWLMANGNLSRTEGRTEEALYFSFYPNNRVTFDNIFEKYKIKVEIGNKATPWTPAPEDLGFEYSSDIQYFNLGIKDNILMTTELIENIDFEKINFIPTDIPNCTLWADVENIEGSNGQTITTLPDLIGSNNFIGSGTLNTIGTKSIVFSGNSMITQSNIDVSGNSPRTMIILGKPYGGGNIFGYGAEGFGLMIDALLASNKFAVHAYGGGKDNLDLAPMYVVNKIQAFSIIYDGTYVSTGVNRDICSPMEMSLDTVSTPLNIGTGVYGVYNNFNGEIIEIIIYNRVLDSTELNTIMDYLGDKRGLLL